ncbi:MAG: SpoIIE family protein phosphatase [Desulfobacterales bacterium]|jgi:PAS domain S-box-containing protein
MIIASLGQAEAFDTQNAVERAIKQCQQQLEGHAPQAGIVFAGINFDHRLMLDEINTHFPGLALIGCTTSGEFSSSYGFSDDSIALMVFYSDQIEFKAGIGRRLSENPEKAVKKAVIQAKKGLTQTASLCLALPDGYNRSFDPIMKKLNQELGQGCPVFGGAAGTLWHEKNMIFQFYSDEILQDSMPILVFGGPLEYTFSIANSWKPVGKRARINASEGRTVKQIADVSAIDFYRHYLGDHTEPAREFVLAVYEENSERFYLRAPIAYNPDGSITFSESIPEGSTVQLTEAIREIIIDDTKASVKKLSAGKSEFHPAFGLAFSCAFRKDVLGTRVGEELKILQDNLPAQVPVSGFYSFGEIAPLAKGQDSYFHGATLVTLLVGQGNGEDLHRKKAEYSQPHGIQDPETADIQLDDRQKIAQLKQANEFLMRKLNRSEIYRQRLEEIKDFNARMHHKIIQEVDDARREIQQKEAALRKSEEKYRRIVTTAGEGFILMNEDLVITDANQAYCQLIGYTKDEIIGKTPLDLATDDFKQYMQVHQEKILSKEYRRFECSLVARDGRHIPVIVHGNTLRDDGGNVIGNMAFVTDMTEQKKALALAAEVQKSLLPQASPRIQGLDVAGKNVSCEEIGGDYFDFLGKNEYPDAPLSIVVGDITGHGVDAALLMTSARAFLRMRAAQSGNISDIITEMNRHLALDVLDTGRFMTLFYMAIDPPKDHLQWVRAGHDPAILYDPGQNTFEELAGTGIALGVKDDFRYETYRKTGLADGQIVAIGTDGIWEACSPGGEMFGKRRFQGVIRDYAKENASNILSAVYDKLDHFTRGLKSEDDITLVIAKVQN